MVIFLMALACSSGDVDDISKTTTKVEKETLSLEKRFGTQYQLLLKKYGSAEVKGYGGIQDVEWFHKFYPYSHLLHNESEWDFVMLATIEARMGVDFLNEMLVDIEMSHPNYKKIIEIYKIVGLTNTRSPKKSKIMFEKFRDSNLSDDRQLELWGLLFEKSIHFRMGSNISEPFTEKGFPYSAKISKKTGFSFEQLALVEYKMGLGGLRFLIKNIPMWVERKECLTILDE